MELRAVYRRTFDRFSLEMMKLFRKSAVRPFLRKASRGGLVCKFIVGSRGFRLRLSPLILLLGILFLGTVWWLVDFWGQTSVAHLQVRVQQLEREVRQQELEKLQAFRALAMKEREKRQMALLAEARAEELWRELRRREEEVRRIWKLVGEKPPAFSEDSFSESRRRRALSGSRSGRRSTLPAIKLKYHRVHQAILEGERELERLLVAARNYRAEKVRQARLAALEATPTLWPVEGTLVSPYGYRVHPLYGSFQLHTGVDIRAPYGAPVRSAAAGRVVYSGYRSGYGLTVEVDHGNGILTLYGHCSSLAVVSGTSVKKGQIIASVGSTGISTGPHLHYEVVVGERPVDPVPYLAQEEAGSPVANRN